VSGVIPQLQVKLNDNNGNTSTTTYVNSNLTHVYEYGPVNFTVTETDALGDVTTHYFYGEQEEERIISDVKQGVLTTTITCYNGNFYNCPSAIIQTNNSGTVNITQRDVYTQLGSSGPWSLVETTYDGYGNTSSVSHWDWGLTSPGSAPTVAATTKTTSTYNGLNGASCGTLANAYQYDRPCSVTTVNSAGTTVAQTNYTYTLGHPTQTSKWISGSTWATSNATYNSNGTMATATDPNTNKTTYNYDGSCNSLFSTSTTPPTVNGVTATTYQAWDCNGGVMASSTDANGNKTTYTHADPLWRLTQVSYPDGGSTTTTYATGSTTPWSVSTSTAITSSTNLTTTTKYDGLGRVTQTQLTSDPSGTDYVDTTYDLLGRKATVSNPHRSGSSSTDGITTYTYDALDRVIQVAQPDGSKVTTSYSANCTTTTDEAGKSRESCADGLGRLTGVWEDPGSSPHLNYETDYTYDALNNLLSVNQRGGSSNSANWRTRTFTYDGLSRLLCAANPEIQIVTCPTSSTGTFPALATLYSYDGNGNLLTKSAPSPNQPTTGTATVTTTYTYDQLNRLTGKSYRDGYNTATPAVTYGYDGVNLTCPTPIGDHGSAATNSIGRRNAMCFNAGSKSWSYDPMGRISGENARFIWVVPPYSGDVVLINGVETLSENTTYAYYLNGDLLKVFYPGPKGPPDYEFTTSENAAGQVTTAGDIYYNVLQNATYAPTGQLATALIGYSAGPPSYNGTSISNTYNSRLQPVLISATTPSNAKVLNLTYNFNLGNGTTGSDNGNVIQIANGKDSNRTQNFLHDSLNRIQQAYTSGPNWGETFSPTATAPGVAPSTPGIDPWGNLTNRSGVTGKTLYEPLSAPALTSNRLTGFGYDAAGNMTSNGSASYVYDDENRLIATAGMSYVYDGDGQRVEKCTEATPGTCASNATGTFYFLHAGGGTLAESNLGGNWTAAYGLIRGQIASRVDLPANVVHYYFHDHLNSTNVVTDNLGNVVEEEDFYPYGGEIVITSGDSNRYKFTGKERDSEDAPNALLDYFGARHYASSMGRYMIPDYADSGFDPVPVPGADFGYPQGLNLYSYVGNSPQASTDPDGHDCIVQTRTSSNTETVSVTSGNCDNVNVGDGQTKTYIAGTVDTSSIKSDGSGGGITFSYTPYSGGAGVADLNVAPVPDRPGIAYGWGSNAQAYQRLAAADRLVTNTTIAATVVYGGIGGVVAGGEIAASTAAARSGIVFRLAHGMRLAAGHSQVIVEAAALKNAIATAISSGLFQKMGDAFEGVVNVAGTYIRFSGGWNPANQMVVSNVMGAALQK
jgi:RHS repeat-associated protein